MYTFDKILNIKDNKCLIDFGFKDLDKYWFPLKNIRGETIEITSESELYYKYPNVLEKK